MSHEQSHITRRTWLTGCARGAVLSGMGVAAGLLVLRGQVQACSLPSDRCPECAVWSTCTLPTADTARQFRQPEEVEPEEVEVQA
jgi:hypothetical protein